MNATKTRMRLAGVLFAVLSLAMMLVLAGCSQPQQPEKESLSAANDAMANGDETEPFYALLVGNDSREGTVEADKAEYADGKGRSDTCMLVYVDPVDYHVALITVPRDTACFGSDGGKMKFNDKYYLNGIDGAVSAVEELTGVKVKYSFDIGFVNFEEFINEIDGVTANVPINMWLQDIVSGEQINLSAGEQHLEGAEALVLARVRKLYGDNLDACRQIQDRAIVQSLIERVANDPSQADACIAALYLFADTDMPKENLTNLVNNFCDNADKLTIVSGTGPYAGGIDGDTNLWLAYRDEDTWHRVIEVVEAGGDPTTVVPLPAVYAK